MVLLGGHPVCSAETRRSLKRKWKGISELTSRPSKKPSSPPKSLSFFDDDFLLGKPNEFLPFVISFSILGSDIKRVLVDQSSAADLMFQDALPELGLSPSDLFPYSGRGLIGLGPEETHPTGRLEALVTYENGELSRAVRTTFTVLPLDSPYRCVVGRPTLIKLGALVSDIHLVMKFHSLTGDVVSISADLNAARQAQHLTMKGTCRRPRSVPEPPETSQHVLLAEVDARYNPDSSDDEGDDALARELKRKIKRPEPEGEFIEVPLRNDPSKTVRIGEDLLR